MLVKHIDKQTQATKKCLYFALTKYIRTVLQTKDEYNLQTLIKKAKKEKTWL